MTNIQLKTLYALGFNTWADIRFGLEFYILILQEHNKEL